MSLGAKGIPDSMIKILQQEIGKYQVTAYYSSKNIYIFLYKEKKAKETKKLWGTRRYLHWY